MGCVPGDDECTDMEKPLVEVTLSPFFIDEYEATNDEILDTANTEPYAGRVVSKAAI